MSGVAVPFLDLGATYRELQHELDDAYKRVMESGWYLLGKELDAFEGEFAEYVGAADCAGVGSGLDALTLALRALNVGPGDEVIVPSNTYVATWLAASAVGATPVPVEPDEQTYNITGAGVAAAITARTSAILPVHLYGLPADVHGISAVAKRHGLPVVYDAAQAHGARVGDRAIGEFGDAVAWSFYPGKNLGAYADAGALTSSNAELVRRVRRLRNYGSEVKYVNIERGVNSRMSEQDAAALRVKLRHLGTWNERRRRIATTYIDRLANSPIQLPTEPDGDESAWHLFVIQSARRDQLQSQLAVRGVQTLIHYPIAPHQQGAYGDLSISPQPVAERMAERVLSLPIGPHMRAEWVDHVVDAVRRSSGQTLHD